MIDYEFLSTFNKQLLHLDKSIRWMAITDKFGVILNADYKEGLKPLMTQEENEEYALSTVTRQKTRIRNIYKTTQFKNRVCRKCIYLFAKFI
jgi:hypothetical protein